jgi:hypothetical protein
MRSTSDQVSGHRHMRSPDELTLPLRPSQSRMSWPPSDSACDPDVKGRCRAVRAASGFAVAVPHARAATVSVRCGHSGQGDFVKLSLAPACAQHPPPPGYYAPPPGYPPPPCTAVSPGRGAVGSAARGAAAGAAFGAIGGNAGRGAAIGATVGGVAGAARRGAQRSAGQCY